MTYEEARTYSKTISKTGSILGLDSIRNLMRELSDVQEKLSILHLAGTNGKGSVGTFLAAGLKEAGYRVGRYTSPAVFSPLEVWQIDGSPITEEEYADILTQVKAACDRLCRRGLPQPTVFEVETAMAFLWFYQKKCDYVLLETGMGGREDATNLITKPLCSVLTSISMDHMQFLGDTLEKIAAEKAGIIKENCPVVSAWQKEEALRVIRQKAEEKKAPLILADVKKCKILKEDLNMIQYLYLEDACKEAEWDSKKDIFTLHMTGRYQIENSMLALTVLRQIFKLPRKTIQKGFAKAGWAGRFEILREKPLFVIDGAHNIDAAEKLKETIENYFTNCRITYIIGILQDKEHRKMLETLLPFSGCVYTVTPENSRAMDGKLLQQEIEKIWQETGQKQGKRVIACDTVEQAVQQALVAAGQADVILAWGSLSYLGRLKECVLHPYNIENMD